MRIPMGKRIEKAQEESMKNVSEYTKEKVLNYVKEALKDEYICGKPKIVQMKDIDKIEINRTKDGKCDSVLFIQFTKSGHIAVVGAGKDYVKNPLIKSKKGTPRILEELRNESGNKEDYEKFQFDVDSIIIIPIENLKSRGLNNATSIMKARNGVEQYIGEYLADKKGIPVLNYYQHWNYSKSIIGN
jgi:hypothetical protein